MKVKLILLFTIILIILTGCDMDYDREYYNNKDEKDFQSGSCIKFDIVQLKNVIDEKTLKESNLNGSFFLFMGSISGKSVEKSITTNTYYGYLKNKNGGIYFAQIPANKVRIYEDSESPCIVAYMKYSVAIDPNLENNWECYDVFNLHIPEGTIIPRIDLNYNLDDLNK